MGVGVLVGIKGRSGSFDSVPDFVQVTRLAPGGHQLLLGLHLLVQYVPVCVGLVDLRRLLGLHALPLLHHCQVQLHHSGLDLVTGVCGSGVQVLVSLEGGSGVLDSISNGDIRGQLVVEGGLEGGECRLRSPQSLLSDEHLRGNPLGLAVHDDCTVVLILGHLHDNLLRLGVGVLGGDDLGVSGGGVQRSASTAAPQTCPWSCSVMIVV
jgi:hypothetical protein